jgi:hypothetical protein
VSVYLFILVHVEIVEVSGTRIKAKRFFYLICKIKIMSVFCYENFILFILCKNRTKVVSFFVKTKERANINKKDVSHSRQANAKGILYPSPTQCVGIRKNNI